MPIYVVPLVDAGFDMPVYGKDAKGRPVVTGQVRARKALGGEAGKTITFKHFALLGTPDPLSDVRAAKIADAADEMPGVVTRAALADLSRDGRQFVKAFGPSIMDLLKDPPARFESAGRLQPDPGHLRAPGYYVHLLPGDAPFHFEPGPRQTASIGWRMNTTTPSGGPMVDGFREPAWPNNSLGQACGYGSGVDGGFIRTDGLVTFDTSVGDSGCERSVENPDFLLAETDSVNVQSRLTVTRFEWAGTSSDRQIIVQMFRDVSSWAPGYGWFLKVNAGSGSVGAFVYSNQAAALATAYVGDVTPTGRWEMTYSGSSFLVTRDGATVLGPSTDTTVDTSVGKRGHTYIALGANADAFKVDLTLFEYGDIGFVFPPARLGSGVTRRPALFAPGFAR